MTAILHSNIILNKSTDKGPKFTILNDFVSLPMSIETIAPSIVWMAMNGEESRLQSRRKQVSSGKTLKTYR